MKGKTRIAAAVFSCGAAVLLLAGVAVLAAPAAQAQGTVPGAPWVPLAEGAEFGPVVPSVDGRPSVLLETDFYVYGGGLDFTVPEVNLTLDNRGFAQPVTLYMYWQNRETEERLHFNARDGFSAQEVSVFSVDGRPVRVFAPNLDDFKLFGDGGAFGPLPAAVPTDTGLYQFVFELRDENGEDVISRGNAMYNHVDGAVQKVGEINADEVWTSNNVYVLTGPVNVFDSTLTIQPGTVVLGQAGFNPGTLIIRPGAQILAEGDAMRPIIMSSNQPVGQRGPGDWGGLVISGNAPTNQQNPEGEGDSGVYGGDDPNDSSGILSYVRVEFAGTRFTEQNELNGIAFQGTGSGFQVDHVQVHFNQDDGVEFFGGTTNAKYVLLTGINDDSLDWTFGWQGKLQFVVVVQQGEESDKGIEADNFEDDPSATPRSNPTISHCTFVKRPEIPQSDPWAQLRRGTAVTIKNCIVVGYDEPTLGPLFLDDEEPPATPGTQVIVDNSFFFDNAGPNPPGTVGSNFFVDPRLADPFALVPDVAPLAGSPARGSSMNIADPFFDAVNFVGGVDPNDPWIYEGWATFSDN